MYQEKPINSMQWAVGEAGPSLQPLMRDRVTGANHFVGDDEGEGGGLARAGVMKSQAWPRPVMDVFKFKSHRIQFSLTCS